MRLRPLFLYRDHDDGPPAAAPTACPVDYRQYSDEQLTEERDRQQRQLEELTRHLDHPSATGRQLVDADDAVERIDDELIRRARQRHPSSRGLAG